MVEKFEEYLHLLSNKLSESDLIHYKISERRDKIRRNYSRTAIIRKTADICGKGFVIHQSLFSDNVQVITHGSIMHNNICYIRFMYFVNT